MTELTDSALIDVIEEFFSSYKEDGHLKYMRLIDDMYVNKTSYCVITYSDLPYEVIEEFNINPERVITALNASIRNQLNIRFQNYADRTNIKINARISQYIIEIPIREINSNNTGKFVTVKANVSKMSAVQSIPIYAVYSCSEGHETFVVADKDYTYTKPEKCVENECGKRNLILNVNKSKYIDYQLLYLQELQSEVPDGQLPKTIGVFIPGDLVDTAKLGDDSIITGVIRPEIIGNIKLGKEIPAIRQRIYANNLETISDDPSKFEITEQDEQNIRNIIEREESIVTETIISSFASHVKGHDIIKEALMLSVIGANTKTLSDGSRVRGDINVFIIGDPGTAKSEMGQAAKRLAPKGYYTSGKGSSAAGLTAAVVQDAQTKTWMLEPGIMAKADKGLVVIDEFDKMESKDRSALHEAMEQQHISINKAGITATLNTRASVIAIANPLYAKYDTDRELIDNIPNVPLPLLTRFDLIFIVQDKPDEEKDLQIAKHLMKAHGEKNPEYALIEPNLFGKYIRLAKRIEPELSNESMDIITKYYIERRKNDSDGFPMTARQLEGLIRLTIARAKMLLKTITDERDANRAIYLMDEMLRSSGAMDSSGNIDVGIVEGKSMKRTTMMKVLANIMEGLSEGGRYGKGVSEEELIKEMILSGKWEDDASAKEFLQNCHKNTLIYEPSPGRYSLV